jgi:O-antigen/teichoic acid export membrane protein
LEKQDYKKTQTLYTKSSINQLIIAGVLFLCIWLNIDDIFSLLPAKFQGGKWVVFYISIAQLFNMITGINGTIIVNSKYYRYDLYTNIILVLTTVITNYFLILKYGIDGAAMATAISISLFNLIRLILIKVKMNMHPFSLQTIKTILLLFVMFFALDFLPNSSYAFVDIIWKSIVVFILFISAVMYFKLSEDINEVIIEVRKKISRQ